MPEPGGVQDHWEFGETDKSSESAEALLLLALSIGNKGYAMMVLPRVLHHPI